MIQLVDRNVVDYMHTIFKFRKHRKILICIFISVLFIIGCPRLLPPETVDYVNVCRYTGLWYQSHRRLT